MIPERFRADVAALLDERMFPLWWIEQQILEGRIVLMENDGAIIGVERREYPGGLSELHGLFAAGDMEAILALVEQACYAAKAAGYTIATIASRPGWSRVLKGQGFEMRQQVISREL